MMNLILDVTRITRRRIKKQTLTGIDRVTMAYIEHYEQQAHALFRWSGRCFLLPLSQSRALFSWIKQPTTTSRVRRILFKGLFLRHGIAPGPANILLNPGYVGIKTADYERLIHQFNVKPVFMVHDLIPLVYPEYFNPDEVVRCQEKIRDMLSLGIGIITNSKATLHELQQHAQSTQLTLPKVKAALLAPGIQSKNTTKRPMEKPYFVILSNIQPHKNHVLLLQLWRNMTQKMRDKTPHLLVIGQRGWKCQHVFDLLERSPLLRDTVTELAGIHDDALSNYIAHSQALLTPSLIEGYGLPLMEALSLGTPVIASDIAVFHEIAGDIPEYIHPLDAKRWEEMILDYAQSNSVKRCAQLARLKTFVAPSWKEHFNEVDAFLSEITLA